MKINNNFGRNRRRWGTKNRTKKKKKRLVHRAKYCRVKKERANKTRKTEKSSTDNVVDLGGRRGSFSREKPCASGKQMREIKVRPGGRETALTG